ncbi:hypothetical protein KC19_N031100 [Ceratodon purpureus]|nr:hypothetical protein KC19_N031100 [Ceratodon purpureus]
MVLRMRFCHSSMIPMLPQNLQSLLTGAVLRNALASSAWPGVAPEDTMLTPTQCRSLWRQFRAETEYAISQALSAQEARRPRPQHVATSWAVAAMVVLGFQRIYGSPPQPHLPSDYIRCILACQSPVWVQLNLGRHFQYGVCQE